MRVGYIIAYDISETKMRTKVFEALKDFGLKHIQESVFWGLLRVSDQNAVRRLLLEACTDTEDRALMWPMSLGDLERATAVNYPKTTFEVQDHVIC